MCILRAHTGAIGCIGLIRDYLNTDKVLAWVILNLSQSCFSIIYVLQIEQFIRSIGIGEGEINGDGGDEREERRPSGEQVQGTKEKGGGPEKKKKETRKNLKKDRERTGTTEGSVSSVKRSREKLGGATEQPTSSDRDTHQQLLSISSKPFKRLLVKPDTEQAWFELSATTEPALPVGGEILAHLSSVATELRKTEVQLYEQRKSFPSY